MRFRRNFNLRTRLPWIILLGMAIALAVSVTVPRRALATGIYSVTRNVVSWYTIHGYPGYLTMTGKDVVVRYMPGDQADAELVLAGAEKYYGTIMADFGVHPAGRAVVVVYPTSASFDESFGGAGVVETMGVYGDGVVRILAPSAWIEAGSPQLEREIFFDEGPMVQELTHLALDDRTKGNAPRWLQEGLAQWEDRKLTGFQLPPPDKDTWYSFTDLTDHFDSLVDQSCGYYQSFAAVRYMYSEFGPDAVGDFLNRLQAGESMNQAMLGAFGENTASFAVQYRKFAG